MILYHGSNVAVREPSIIVSNRALDFGAGFYTTSNLAKAEKWAKLQCYRRGLGAPNVTAYDFDEAKASALRVLRFSSPDQGWLRFVVQNRRNSFQGPGYDIVIGPVANDNTMPVINDFMAGRLNEETTILLLKPQKLADQYAFLTFKGLSCLKCNEVREYV